MTSKNTSFENKEQGSWKAVKSAKWISKEQAQVTFDIDTTLMTNEILFMNLNFFNQHTIDKLYKNRLVLALL